MRYALLVLLAVVGMLPASLLPVVVSALRGGLGLAIGQAATVGGAAILSAAVGAFFIALVGVPVRWKVAAAVGLATLCVLDLASFAVTAFIPLLAVRVAHGLVGGMLTGIGYAAIGRTAAPDRLFGVLLALQFLVGGAGIAVLPGWIAATGLWLLFAVLAGAAVLVLGLLPVMPDMPVALRPARRRAGNPVPRGPLLSALAALLLLQAGHTAGSAFMLELGQAGGTRLPAVQAIVGLSGMAGVIGAVAAALVGARHGRRGPVLWAGVAGVASGILLLLPSPAAFAAGAFLGSIAWAWSIPFVLGGCAAIDPDTGGAIWSSFFAKLGLATGPLLGALVVSENGVKPAIMLACALGLAGMLLFLRLERRRPVAMA